MDETRRRILDCMRTEPTLSELLGDGDYTFEPDPVGTASREEADLDHELSDLTRTMSVSITAEQSIELAAEMTGLSVERVREIQKKKPIWETLNRGQASLAKTTKPDDLIKAKMSIFSKQPFFREFKEHPLFKNFQRKDCEEMWDSLVGHCVEYCESALKA